MRPADANNPETAASGADNPHTDATERAFDPPHRFAFTRSTRAPTLAQVNGNVAAVLSFIAAVMDQPEHPITLDPVAADGLAQILDAAHHDLLDAAELARG